MVKRIPGSGWLTSGPLQILANNRLICTRPALRAARVLVRRRGSQERGCGARLPLPWPTFDSQPTTGIGLKSWPQRQPDRQDR
jgi:hypothetical protein